MEAKVIFIGSGESLEETALAAARAGNTNGEIVIVSTEKVDLANFAQQLCSVSVKEATELVETLRNEYGIGPYAAARIVEEACIHEAIFEENRKGYATKPKNVSKFSHKPKGGVRKFQRKY